MALNRKQNLSNWINGNGKSSEEETKWPIESDIDDIESDNAIDEIVNSCKKLSRSRTVFTEFQLMGLKRSFDSHKYLSTQDRANLAQALNLTQLQVKTWFQNRRMKWKRQVMENGRHYPPTMPKGRPKKDSIPTYGIDFTNQILSPIFDSKQQQSCGNTTKKSGLVSRLR